MINLYLFLTFFKIGLFTSYWIVETITILRSGIICFLHYKLSSRQMCIRDSSCFHQSSEPHIRCFS